MINKKLIARGNGPPPPGFVTCHDAKCSGRRDPCTGRFSKLKHYHPIVNTSEGKQP